jgi:hypothetical protein
VVIDPELLEKAKKEFIPISGSRGGQYEATFHAAHGAGSADKMLREWEQTFANVGNGTIYPDSGQLLRHIKAQAKTPQECIQTWMGVLQAWGIKRGSTEPFVVTEDNGGHHFYHGGSFESLEGKEVHVQIPHWTLGDSVLERGVVVPDPSMLKKPPLPQADFTHLVESPKAAAGQGMPAAAREAESWISKIEKMSSGKKWAAGIAAAATIAGAGWTWHVKHRRNEQKAPDQESSATR